MSHSAPALSPSSPNAAFREWPGGRVPVAQPEKTWMCAPSSAAGAAASQIRVGRWVGDEVTRPLERIADHDEPAHTISYCLRHQQINFVSENRVIVPATMLRGSMLLQAPTSATRRGVVRSGYDVLRIYLPADMIAECHEEATGKAAPQGLALFDPHVTNDPVLRNLAQSLVSVDSDGGTFGPAFVEGVGMALAARLVALSLAQEHAVDRASPPLAKWRLNRVMAYLEENLGEPISLDDLSAVAGLSRTHFAGQFRAATGFGPHAYILKRRIEAAQSLLQDEEKPISEIALELGFSSQAHFSTAFKNQVGVAPGRWRSAVIDRQVERTRSISKAESGRGALSPDQMSLQ